ncbi:MAG TPA: hypothetical protein VMB27_06110 [Solirubrobacteraceae bacterium]|nr:hypothetical protein [Solirubrobacteraceae bacterium]
MRTTPLILVLMSAAAIAGCGSSNGPRAGGQSVAAAASGVAFAACMREHGVPNYPDPTASGAGGGGGAVAVFPAGVDRSAPAFKSASASCGGSLLPGLGAHHQASAETTEETLKFSECMRAHGVTGFPDPTASAPTSLSGYSAVIRRGVFLAIPDTIDMASPTYKRAAAACRFGPAFS